MADQQKIGDILSQRRRQLGLSIDRVVDGTKLQRRIIEAFENSDFDQMPPKGYAKATLGSYARFLGLDANDVIRVYEDQLYYHEREMAASARGPRSSSTQGRAGSVRRTRAQSSTQDQVRGSSATGGRLSNNLSRAYSDTPASERSSSRRRETRSDGSQPRDTSRYRERRNWEEPYETQTSRGLYDFDTTGDPSVRRSSRERHEFDDEREYRRTPRRSSERTTQVVSLDDGYQGGSGRETRVSGQVRPRRSASDRVRESLSMAGSLDGMQGVLRGITSFFSQNRLAALITFAALALALVVALVIGVSSCSRSRANSSGATIPVVSVGDTSDATDQANQQSDNATNQPAQDATQQQPTATDATQEPQLAAPDTANTQAPAAPAPLDLAALPYDSTLTFTVAADAQAQPWIEVTVDGVAVYAANAAAGETQTYTLTSAASMALSNPELVTITVNNVVVQPTVDELGNASVELAVSAEAQAAAADQAAADQAAADQAALDQAAYDQTGEQGDQTAM